MTPEAARAYAECFETLGPETLASLRALCRADMRFRDPFTDITGADKFISVFARMFRGLDAPRFTVLDRAVSGNVLYLRWDFDFRRGGRPWHIEGMSEVHFDEGGLVTAHLDHWDSGAQFYARLPVLGRIIRLIMRRVGGH